MFLIHSSRRDPIVSSCRAKVRVYGSMGAAVQVAFEVSPSHAGLAYHHIPVYDIEDQDIVNLFPQCFSFIDQGRSQGT